MIDILATGGNLETPRITRVYWAVLEGIAAAVLLLVGGSGSLTALQTASIATAVPFSIVMVLACVSMLKAFRYEVATAPRYLQIAVSAATPAPGGHGAPTGGASPRRSPASTPTETAPQRRRPAHRSSSPCTSCRPVRSASTPTPDGSKSTTVPARRTP